jgi:hypothetical protein
MTHSDKFSPKRIITPAMLDTLEATKVENTNLRRQLDNAVQDIFISPMPGYEPASETLRDMAKASGHPLKDVDAAMSALYELRVPGMTPRDFHKHPLSSAQNFHEFYSLAYHLTLEEGDKRAIEQVFKTLELEPPLSRQQAAEALPGILALGENKGRQKV